MQSVEIVRGLSGVVVAGFGLFLIGLAALIATSPSHAERLLRWLIIISSATLLLIPWQWHHRFATLVMPPVFRRLRLFALGAFALGAFILYSVFPVVTG